MIDLVITLVYNVLFFSFSTRPTPTTSLVSDTIHTTVMFKLYRNLVLALVLKRWALCS